MVALAPDASPLIPLVSAPWLSALVAESDWASAVELAPPALLVVLQVGAQASSASNSQVLEERGVSAVRA